MKSDPSKKRRTSQRSPTRSLYEHVVFTHWLIEPFTLSLRWAYQVISQRYSSVDQLTPDALTELFHTCHSTCHRPPKHSQPPSIKFSPQVEKMSAERASLLSFIAGEVRTR